MHRKTLIELKDELDGGHCSSEELVRHFLERIQRLDPRLNCFITTTPDAALEAARAADRQRREGDAGPLSGLPIAHKDIFCTRDLATTCGSRMLANFIAPYDATCVARLGAAGAVTLGKTNMDEFAMGSSTETSYFGPTRNPWDLDAVPGGSSGGSAAAVAAGLVPAATGTDTGGSIRQPASLCGVTGLKPTYGRVSRYGMIAFASSLDQGGAFGRSAADVALVLEGMAAFDPRDSTSVDTPVPAYGQALNGDIRGLRVGVPREYLAAGLDDRVAAAVHAAVEALAAQGAEVRQVSLPHTAYSVPAYYVLASAECSSNLSRYDGVRFGYRCDEPRDLMDLYKRSRGEGFGAEVQRRIMVGTYTLSSGYYEAYYAKAQRMRRLIQRDFTDAFESVDILACPVSPTPAFNLGEKLDDPVTMYLSDVFTIAVNLAGLPALSAPAGFVEGRPVGLQLIGNYFDEARILNAAHAYQQATDWHRRLPEAFA